MKHFVVFILVFLGVTPVLFSQTANTVADLKKTSAYLKPNKSNTFEENKGQITGKDAQTADFVFKKNNLFIFLRKTGFIYQFNKIIYPEGYKSQSKFETREENRIREKLEKEIRHQTFRIDMVLVNANANSVVIKEGRSNDYTNYYTQNVTDVHTYSKVTYKEIYPHIDWVIYIKDASVEYDFVVRPGGNPNNIKFRSLYGQQQLLNNDGSLQTNSSLGNIVQHAPVAMQDKRTIPVQFRLKENEITFDIKSYNRNEPLVIDPQISWGTYYGNSYETEGNACSTDPSGNVFMAGSAMSSINIASGGFQNSFGGNMDAFLAKFTPAGVRLWGTYYGGSDGDYGRACATDASGNVYLTGTTYSPNNIGSGGFQNAYSGYEDAFLVKFNSNGMRLWGTYYGTNYGTNGGYGEDNAYACAVDPSGNVYMAGTTNSTSGIASGGFMNTYNGPTNTFTGCSPFLVKFSPTGARLWGTYYGNSQGSEGAYACATDNAGNIYIAGCGGSTGLASPGAFQTTFGGGGDAFLAKFNAAGNRLWGTLYGGSGLDYGYGCATDPSGNVYLSGTTSSANMASGGHQNTFGGYSVNAYSGDAYIAKFNASGTRLWATYYGGSDDELGETCATDLSGNIYLTGFTFSSNNIASGNGFQNTYGGTGSSYNNYGDAFWVKFNAAGVRQWGTYCGGSNGDAGFSCATAPLGDAYLVGQTASPNNIALNGFQDSLNGGINEAFLIKVCGNTVEPLFSPFAPICSGTPAPVLPSISNNGISGTWSPSVVNNTSSSTYVFTPQEGQCADTATITITVHPVTTPFFNIASSICSGSVPPSLSNISSNGITGIWNPSIVNNTLGGTYTFTPNAGQCADTISLSINVNPATLATFNIVPSICYGAAAPILPIVSNNGISGIWSPSVVSNTNTGNYVFTPSPNQCAAPLSITITVNPVVAVFDTISSICYGAVTPALPLVSSNGVQGVWNPSVISNVSSGVYTFTPNIGQCATTSSSILLTVNPLYENTIDTFICATQAPYSFGGQSLTLSGNYNHVFSSLAGCDSTVHLHLAVGPKPITPPSLTLSNCHEVIFEGNVYTESTILKDTFYSIAGCDSLYRKVYINVIHPDTVELAESICMGETYLFDGTYYNASGTYKNAYTEVDGCDSVRILHLTVNQLPDIKFSFKDEGKICRGDTIIITASGGTTYQWQVNEIRFSNINPLNIYLYNSNNNIILKAVDINNCTDSTEFSVTAEDCCGIMVPNAFSPNGDGLNDMFGALTAGHPDKYLLKIFDRWGNLIFSSLNIYKQWDGNINGKPADLGTYFFLVQSRCLNGKEYLKKGEVTLLR